ncbi:unnamed protein product [Camellia sinensis]
MRILHQIHAHLLTHPLPISTISFAFSKIVGFSALSPHGDINYARKLFSQIPSPNIFSWNSLIRAYSHTQYPSTTQPICLFKKLIKRGFPKPNTFTLAFVLKACYVVSSFEEGQQVHSRVVRSGFGSSPFVETALINFYAKCEHIVLAKKVFDEIPERNLFAWNTMICGYSKIKMVNEAFGLFREMQKVGIAPDEVTMVSVISACAASGALDVGRWIHAYIDKHLIDTDLELSTSLVNMYAKCGSIEKAIEVFDKMPIKDTKAWSSMIVGMAIHGLAEDAMEAFSRMEETKVKPNHVTFIGVLLACAHSGRVLEGKKYWSSMLESGVVPSMEHYGCMVDLLCRANLVEEACTFVETMSISPDVVIWRTLLVACKKNRNMEKGEIAGSRLLELEPLNAENYVLLSNLYASGSEWAKMSHVRKLMKDKEIKAVPGCSCIEIDGFMHEFVMGDCSHPEAKEIREVLKDISERVCGDGYEPWTLDVLHNVGDEEKESALCEHTWPLLMGY